MRKSVKLLIALLAAFSVGIAALVASIIYRPSDFNSRVDLVQGLAAQGVARDEWPALSWAVVAPGEVLVSGATGFASIEFELPMTEQIPMPVGSISKVITGIAGATAINDGLLDESAAISDYLSFDFSALNGSVPNFVQLATHTSGILDNPIVYGETSYFYGDTKHPLALEEFLIAYFTDGGEYHSAENFGSWAPGERYDYSNTATGLAAQVIAEATGQSFETYSQAALLNLNLNAFWGHTRPADESPVTLYGRDEVGHFEPLPPYALATWPDGQWNSSAVDLARLLAALLNEGEFNGEQVLPASVVQQLKTSRISAMDGFEEDPGDWVGLFWTRETLALGPFSMSFEGHNGGDPGLATFMYTSPGSDTGFVVMMNGHPKSFFGELLIARLLYVLSDFPAN